MKTSGNTLLITGGGSGIGRALAESFHRRGNQVIIAGRRRAVLEEVVRANPGMVAMPLDLENPSSIPAFARALLQAHPGLDGVIHNAGIMKPEDLRGQTDTTTAEATVTTNLLGPIRLNAALLPHLVSKPSATIMTVTSGLAFIPLARTPTYCATKAALHSYTESLRFQLRDTGIQVLELAPPYVQTELLRPQQASDPNAMPLEEFIVEVMHLLETQPRATEICVERVKPLRFAARGDYDAVFRNLNSP